jgi:hypothetical protein
VLVLQEVRVLDLELEPGAVSVPERALDDVRLGAAPHVRFADSRDDLGEARPVRLPEETGEFRSLDFVHAVAEHPLDRGALVRDHPVRVENRDEVARVRDERPEARLALAAMKIFREGRAFDGEGDLRGERLERVDELARDGLFSRQNEEPSWFVPH